ncbi:MAG: hypothetical protein ACI4UK_03130 [Floccifex sp.]
MAKLNRTDPSPLFFDVVERNVFWEKVHGGLFHEDNFEYTKRYKAIVDKERDSLFVISRYSYQLITNKEALDEGKRIAGLIFSDNVDNNEHFKFDLYSYSISANRANCAMILARDIDIKQPFICDAWSPVLIVTNSYNKTVALRYTIGFSFLMTNLIFPQTGKKFEIPIEKGSTKYFHDQISEILYKKKIHLYGLVKEAMRDFSMKIERLKRQKVTNNMYLAMFCKFFNIEKSKYYTQDILIPNKTRKLIYWKDTFINSWGKNSNKYGLNAYSFLLTILDYVTNCDVMNEPTDVYEYQLQAGKWADDYLTAASHENFDAMSYLGDYFNTSVWLEPLSEIDVVNAENELKNFKSK